MKLTIAGETCSAAQIRSPSFSRSSSSATTMNLPARTSAIACSIVPKGTGGRLPDEVRRRQTPHVLADHVSLDVHDRPGLETAEGRVAEGIVDEGDLDDVRRRQVVDGQAHAVDGERPMWDQQLHEVRGNADVDEHDVS